MKYEYKIIDTLQDGNCDNEWELNELGKENWQLVAIYNDKFYFIRRVMTIHGRAFESPEIPHIGPVIKCIHPGSYVDSSGWHCPKCGEHRPI